MTHPEDTFAPGDRVEVIEGSQWLPVGAVGLVFRGNYRPKRFDGMPGPDYVGFTTGDGEEWAGQARALRKLTPLPPVDLSIYQTASV